VRLGLITKKKKLWLWEERSTVTCKIWLSREGKEPGHLSTASFCSAPRGVERGSTLLVLWEVLRDQQWLGIPGWFRLGKGIWTLAEGVSGRKFVLKDSCFRGEAIEVIKKPQEREKGAVNLGRPIGAGGTVDQGYKKKQGLITKGSFRERR